VGPRIIRGPRDQSINGFTISLGPQIAPGISIDYLQLEKEDFFPIICSIYFPTFEE
jgi:hypothetical protein